MSSLWNSGVVIPRSTLKPSRTNATSSGNKSDLPGIVAGELFENSVRDVLFAGKRIGFRGVVDIELDLKNTMVDSRGFIVAMVRGSDQTTSSTSIRIATRIHLEDYLDDGKAPGPDLDPAP